jgi:hypothetical protein
MKYVFIVLILIVIGKREKFISKAIKKKEVKKITLEVVFLILLICFAYFLYSISSGI